ncbi:MAG: right-handed parallel beta-helix repeat-containing protein [Thermoplasmata archaeon]|nr:right-handed parallel beta-helix repeat-containing protein [Thermoplasmata archaeon]
MRKWSFVVVVMFLGVLFSALTISPNIVKASTLYVGGGSPGNYTTIQGAIDDANPGDTIYVYSGTYYENVRVDKTLSLIGEDRNATIIDGDGTADVLRVFSDWVNVTDFTVTGSGPVEGNAGIDLYYVENCHISRNNVLNNDVGLHLYHSNNNTITDINASSNRGHGIWLVGSHNNILIREIASLSLRMGVDLAYSHRNLISDTHTFRNNWSGIYLYYSDNNTITNNNFSSNDGGINFFHASNNTITNNLVSLNSYGVYLWSSINSRVYHNNLQNNTDQAHDDTGTNQWDNGYPSGGNHWSDYTDVDEKGGPNQDQPGSDGIGDAPYDILGGTAEDRYPLMSPFEPTAGPPSAPWNLHAVPGSQQITLTWFPPLDDGGSPITNYTIYRGTTSGGEILLVTTGDVNSYVDTGLTNGVTYYYLLAAVNGVGEGANSIEVSATPFNQAPVCSIGTPDSEATISDTYIISGNASDDDGTVEGVEIRIDDGPWVQVNGTMSWSYEWDTTHESNGEHTIYARSHDGQNYSTEVSVHVEVYNLPHGDPVAGQIFWWVMIGLVIAIAGAGLISEVRRRKKQT